MTKNSRFAVPSKPHFPIAGPHQHTSTKPADGGTFPAAGPAVHLSELPDPANVKITDPAQVDTYLGLLEAARRRQLDAMAPATDAVGSTYRATVVRILEDIRAARQRLATGLYGLCTQCTDKIAPARLQVRPAVANCLACASREHR